MLICMECKAQLTCTKVDVAAEYPQNRIFPGSLYECPNCKMQILKTRNHSISDPDYRFSNSYIPMAGVKSKIDLSGEEV